MDKKTEYFIKKIERAINDGNYTDAKIYYDKAILYLGQIPEVIAYKSTIDSEIKRTKPNNQGSEDISGIRKRKPINEALIILPIMALVIIGYLFYFFTNTYPMHHITKELSHTWYQGDLSSSSSEGVYLEFKSLFNEIYYRTRSGNLIAKFEYKIVNGKEITVDGYPIRVEFDGDYVTFSPSFVDISEKSVWRSNRNYTSSDKTGNFSKDDTQNSSDLSHNDSLTNSNSTISDNNSGDNSSSSGSLPSGETGNDSSANTSTGDHTNVSDNVNDTTCAKGHTWKEATCTEPATCTVCGITTGSAKGHTWKEATCTEPATCTVCGITSGSANGHTWLSISQTVHHNEEGHYEWVEVKSASKWYHCPRCGSEFESLNDYYYHFDSNHSDTIFLRDGYTHGTIPAEYEEKWIVDREAYDETVITGYRCSICGQTK